MAYIDNQFSRYGAIARALPFTPGKIFWVLNSSDSWAANFASEFPTDRDGYQRVFTSVPNLNTITVSGRNDVVIFDSASTHTLTAMLSLTNNQVHLRGLDYLLGVNREYGQGSKISLGVTTAATDIATFKNTGVRNSIKGIKFLNSNTVAEGIYCVAEGGEYTEYENFEFYKSTDLDVTGAAELLLNGDSCHFKNGTIGSLADLQSGATVRANVLLTQVLSGKVMRECKMTNVRMLKRAGHVNNRFIYAAANADVERSLELQNCKMLAAANSTATPAEAIGAGASLTVGGIYCDVLTYTNATKISSATGVFTAGVVPTGATSGIIVNAA